MPRLTRSQVEQIEQYLQVAINDYPVPEEHYAYVSTLLTHIQADFSQLLMEFPLDEDELQAEIARLKAELKKAGKAYGRASAAIGSLRRDLAMARLYRVCWRQCQESECARCRTAFAETPFYERVPELTPEQLASIPRRKIKLPADTPVVGKGQFEEPGSLEGVQRERSRTRPIRPMAMEYFGPIDGSPEAAQSFADRVLQPEEIAALESRRGHGGCGHIPTAGITIRRNAAQERMEADAAAFEDDAGADAVMAQELADDEAHICAAAYTDSGRDTGHALCGSAEGPIAVDNDRVSCLDCVRLLSDGWDLEED
jgi:hypothetical protein